MIIDPFLNNQKTLYYKKFMSNLQNTEILENLFEDALEQVTRKNKYQFPPCTEEELNSTASELAKQWLEELPEPSDYDG